MQSIPLLCVFNDQARVGKEKHMIEKLLSIFDRIRWNFLNPMKYYFIISSNYVLPSYEM